MDWIIENPVHALGSVLGAGGFVLLGFYSGGAAFFTSTPLTAAAGIISTGAFTGMVSGTFYNDSQKKKLSEMLSEEYGIDSSKIYTYDLEDLPSEVKNLCAQYMEYDNKNRTYAEINRNALGLAAFLMMAQAVYDTGKTMSEYWAANKGGSGALEGPGKYLEAPAAKDGTLNIGAGTKPVEGAYNVDLNSQVTGVHTGDATNLGNVATNSQSKVIMENPYGYDPLNPEVYRVLEKGGTVNISGGMSNKYFNRVYKMTDVELQAAGYEVISKGVSSSTVPAYTTSGEPIKGTIMEIILKKQ